MFVRLAHLFCNYEGKAKLSKRPVLVTLAYSHYVEFARWCLEYQGIQFYEVGLAPGQHILPTLSIRVGRSGQKHFSSSSSVSDLPDKPKISPTSSPVMVNPDGSVDRDSWEIAARSKLLPADPELKVLIDQEFGPLTRQWAYFFFLKSENVHIFDSLCTDERHWLWRTIYFFGFGSYLKSLMVKMFKSNDKEAFEECNRKLEVVVEKLSSVLRSRKGKFLGGDCLGQADISIAALAAAIVFPDLFAKGFMAPYAAQLSSKDKDFAEGIEKWRKTEVGEYCLELYSKYRLASISSNS